MKIKLTLIIKNNHSYSVIVFRRFTGISDEIDLQNYFKLKKSVCSFILTTIRIFYINHHQNILYQPPSEYLCFNYHFANSNTTKHRIC